MGRLRISRYGVNVYRCTAWNDGMEERQALSGLQAHLIFFFFGQDGS